MERLQFRADGVSAQVFQLETKVKSVLALEQDLAEAQRGLQQTPTVESLGLIPDIVDVAVPPSSAEERVSLASNWTLVWWRFRKHHLAMASAVVLLGLYAVVLCPDFFSTQDPEYTEARLAFIPVQRPRLLEGMWWSPSVPAVVGKRNPTTLRMEWQVDPSQKVRVRLFVRGYPYRVLGLLPTFGVRLKSQKIEDHVDTGAIDALIADGTIAALQRKYGLAQ